MRSSTGLFFLSSTEPFCPAHSSSIFWHRYHGLLPDQNELQGAKHLRFFFFFWHQARLQFIAWWLSPISLPTGPQLSSQTYRKLENGLIPTGLLGLLFLSLIPSQYVSRFWVFAFGFLLFRFLGVLPALCFWTISYMYMDWNEVNSQTPLEEVVLVVDISLASWFPPEQSQVFFSGGGCCVGPLQYN